MSRFKFAFLAFFIFAACSSSGTSSNGGGNGDGGGGGTVAIIADHLAAAAFGGIPESYITQAINSFKIFYGHTSHGSQIITGLEMLQNAVYNYAGLSVEEYGSDLGDSEWPAITRNRLNEAGSDINVVMWSWCGQLSGLSSSDVDAYLSSMSALEGEYPSVKFIYMTGHTDGTGESGTLRTNNKRIRDYVAAHNKILFDFADVESYDPDGTYYADTSDDCGWCTTWCASHTCPGCGSCAHSHCFNCYLKGKAFWWLLARIGGWSG